MFDTDLLEQAGQIVEDYEHAEVVRMRRCGCSRCVARARWVEQYTWQSPPVVDVQAPVASNSMLDDNSQDGWSFNIFEL